MKTEAIKQFILHWRELRDQLSATEAEMLDSAAAQLDALEARIAELEGALRSINLDAVPADEPAGAVALRLLLMIQKAQSALSL